MVKVKNTSREPLGVRLKSGEVVRLEAGEEKNLAIDQEHPQTKARLHAGLLLLRDEPVPKRAGSRPPTGDPPAAA